MTRLQVFFKVDYFYFYVVNSKRIIGLRTSRRTYGTCRPHTEMHNYALVGNFDLLAADCFLFGRKEVSLTNVLEEASSEAWKRLERILSSRLLQGFLAFILEGIHCTWYWRGLRGATSVVQVLYPALSWLLCDCCAHFRGKEVCWHFRGLPSSGMAVRKIPVRRSFEKAFFFAWGTLFAAVSMYIADSQSFYCKHFYHGGRKSLHVKQAENSPSAQVSCNCSNPTIMSTPGIV